VEALYYMGVVLMAQGRHAQAVSFLERARSRSPNDPVIIFQLGLAFFADQRYDRAQPLLEEAFRRDPTLNSAGYYVGFLRYRNKDYRGALAAFRAGRATDPEIQQLTRFYSGLALGILGLPTQAAAEIEQAVRLLPGSALTGPAERIRDTILAARRPERRLSAEVRFGFLFDDNVAVIPNRDRDEPLVAALRPVKHESTGELLGLRADYVWFEHEGWSSSIGYSFFATYNNELPKFNVTDHLVNVGLTKALAIRDMPFQAATQYAFDVLFLDDDEFIQRHTLTASATLAASARHLTQVFGRYQNKQFNETDDTLRDEIRDGHNYTIGATHILRFANDRHFLKGGYQFDYEDTEGINYEYLGHRLLAGGQYTLPWWEIRLRYDVDVHFRGYTHRNSILPTPSPATRWRRDRELTNIARVELPLPARLTLSAEYQSTLNASNIEIFDYKRNVVSLILTWTY
jgi:tetratricopeptide (TPR) repeat protein